MLLDVVDTVTFLVNQVTLAVTNIPSRIQHRGQTQHEFFVPREFNQRISRDSNTLRDVIVYAVVFPLHIINPGYQFIDTLRSFVGIPKEFINGHTKIIGYGRNEVHVGVAAA